MKLIKKTKEWGNGAGVRVPRRWLGMDVEVRPIAPLAVEEVQKEVVDCVKPYLADIEGVYLAGSYARMEQTSASDIDILVITEKPFNIRKKEPYDVYAISKDKINKVIKYYPLQIMSMIKEARPIINKTLLNDLRMIRLKPIYFKEYFESTKRSLKIINDLISDYKDSDIATGSLIYPIILRLRGLYLAEALLKNKECKVSKIKKDIEKSGIGKERLEEIYRIYQIKRDTKKNIKSNITISEIRKIYSLALGKYEEAIKWLKEK